MIGKTFMELYTKLFSSQNLTLTPQIEELFPSVISEEQKKFIASISSSSKIKEALWISCYFLPKSGIL